MNGETQSPIRPDSARRRLMRGAFSAPAVLTLYSGSALAATSSTCQANVNQNVAVVTSSASSTTDTYLRYQLRALRKEKVNGNQPPDTYWIQGSDLINLKVPTSSGSDRYLSFQTGFQPSRVQWQQINGGDGKRINDPVNKSPLNGQEVFVDSGKFVVLRVDSSGVVIGVGADTAGDVISSSCWVSTAIARR